jgi:glycosyltransferase involved in cell wall biosynthesis
MGEPTNAHAAAGRRILVVYPHNLMLRDSGINSRTYEVFKYLTRREFRIDLLGLSGFVDKWPESHHVHTDDVHIENVFLYDFHAGRPKATIAERLVRKARSLLSPGRIAALPDYAFPGMKRYFHELVDRTAYDFILVSYAYWAGLVEGRTFPGATLMLEISDFLTLNLHDTTGGRVDLGALLTEEVRRVNLFERVFCISDDEMRFFSRLATRPAYFFVPHFQPSPAIVPRPRTADVCFIASDNPHNVRGINWFYDHVMPHLPTGLRYLIVGKITDHLPRKLDNVTAIRFVDDLGEIYGSSAVAVCPLLGGTGMKIKVIEALGHGVPVVCTRFGVTGFQDRRQTGCSVTDDPVQFADLIRRLVEDPQFHREQAALALAYFRDSFEQSRVENTLDQVFAVGRGSPEPAARAPLATPPETASHISR